MYSCKDTIAESGFALSNAYNITVNACEEPSLIGTVMYITKYYIK